MIAERPKKRRKSIIRTIKCWFSDKGLEHDVYISKAFASMIEVSLRRPEARRLRPYISHANIPIDEIADLTFDFLKTSPVYNNDNHCYEFMDDNLIPYTEVDNTKPNTYIM